ncbi:hypothetical protein VNI00_002313 [Paramarasmius palmivorus]|uniref:Uncharacterized protein n=1 Tax=Paramarasmius palmivorus TaxID=297713 RepID=A0AAW0DXH0_9AGAR
MSRSYVPPTVRDALRWSNNDPLEVIDVEELGWEIINSSKAKTDMEQALKEAVQYDPSWQVPMLPSSMSNRSKLCGADLSKKCVISGSTAPYKTDVIKRVQLEPVADVLQPNVSSLGAPIWSNNSCAYDALFDVLWPLWNSDT